MHLVWSLVGGAFLWAGGAIAQQPPDTINVIGRRPADLRSEALEFVRRLGVAERPVARWVEPICPLILGVAPELGRLVADKIRTTARDTGVRVARMPCVTNITISFVADGGALVREINRKSPNRIGEVAPQDRAWLLGDGAPIRWWHATEMRTRDGMGTTGNEQPAFARLEGPGGVPMAGEVHFQYRSSITSTQMARVLRAATVIIDVNDSTGMALDSVAAFAALVSLAEIRPGDEAPENSILGMFKGGGAHELTSMDVSFLRALYRLPLDRTALAQRGLIVRGLLNPSGIGAH